jgi:hypothetical protein
VKTPPPAVSPFAQPPLLGEAPTMVQQILANLGAKATPSPPSHRRVGFGWRVIQPKRQWRAGGCGAATEGVFHKSAAPYLDLRPI